MAIDFTFIKGNDAILVIEMQPPEPIGGWSIQFLVQKRLGTNASGLVTKSIASGLAANASGIEITNSGAGVMQVAINAGDTSGWNPGNYQYKVQRMDSGSVTDLAKGCLMVLP